MGIRSSSLIDNTYKWIKFGIFMLTIKDKDGNSTGALTTKGTIILATLALLAVPALYGLAGLIRASNS